jgi:hypothetical protein
MLTATPIKTGDRRKVFLRSGKKRMLSPTAASHHSHQHFEGTFIQKLGQIFTLKRLVIVASVLAFFQIIGKEVRKYFNVENDHLLEEKPQDYFKEAAINFSQFMMSFMLAMMLENLLPNMRFAFKKGKFIEFSKSETLAQKGFRGAIAEALSNDTLKVALSLAAFNTILEGLGHYAHSNRKIDQNNHQSIDLAVAAIKLLGSYLVARFAGGATSISGILSSSCVCCGLPVCAMEIFAFCDALLKLATGRKSTF